MIVSASDEILPTSSSQVGMSSISPITGPGAAAAFHCLVSGGGAPAPLPIARAKRGRVRCRTRTQHSKSGRTSRPDRVFGVARLLERSPVVVSLRSQGRRWRWV